MKIALTVIFFLLSFTGSLEARIGESPDQLKARYGEGKPSQKLRVPGTQRYDFKKDGFTIDVSFKDGKSVAEYFHRDAGKISDDEIKDLLKGYREGVRWTWSARDNIFKSSDKKMIAGREPGHEDFFFVKDLAVAKTDGKEEGVKGL